MLRSKHFIIILLGFIGPIKAQTNLVPNPSFELNTQCPNSLGDIDLATPWFQPNQVAPSSDYFNVCSTYWMSLVPQNVFGFQTPHTGQAYAGIIIGNLNGIDAIREYLEVELDSALLAGKKYCVSFYISCADYVRKATDGLGVYFSSSPITYFSSTWDMLPYLPQVENISGNVFYDTLNWNYFEQIFIANGNEKFMTIGNFRPDSLCNVVINPTGIFNETYIYIDDVSVVNCDSSTFVIDNSLNILKINPNPVETFLKIDLPDNKSVNSIKVISTAGSLVIDSQNNNIDVSELPSGVYFIQVYYKTNNFIGKFIKR